MLIMTLAAGPPEPMMQDDEQGVEDMVPPARRVRQRVAHGRDPALLAQARGEAGDLEIVNCHTVDLSARGDQGVIKG